MNIVAALSALMLAIAFGPAAALPAQPQAASIKGEVLETRNVDSYTYLRLKTGEGEVWAAVPTTALKPGAQVTIGNATTMRNFESKTLKKTFDSIVFGQLVDPNAKPAAPQGASPAAPPAAPAAKVAKATGPDARTVAEVVTGKASLNTKTVQVRAQVVKVSLGIMGKNWLHLQDGSGKASDGSNDILVTTQDQAAVGDIVTARGTVRTDVNLGSGYVYSVLIENAALRK
ncbi:MAG: nucleotide-binding protein [Rubrivivax sp.]